MRLFAARIWLTRAMTLESIYYIGQTVAVVVIVLTLLAILYQGYQTNKIARADLTLNMWMQAGAAHHSFVDTPQKANFMREIQQHQSHRVPRRCVPSRHVPRCPAKCGRIHGTFDCNS